MTPSKPQTPAHFDADQLALDIASSAVNNASSCLYDASDIILRTFPYSDREDQKLLITAKEAEALRERISDLREKAIALWQDLNKARGIY